MLYPGFAYRTNVIIHKFYEIFFHFLPSIIFDFILKLQGTKPIMVKIAKKIKIAAKSGEYFALREYNFEANNMRMLCKCLKQTKDDESFNCDVSKVNWDNYVETFLLGIRKFILKDDISSMTTARKKIRRYKICFFFY